MRALCSHLPFMCIYTFRKVLYSKKKTAVFPAMCMYVSECFHSVYHHRCFIFSTPFTICITFLSVPAQNLISVCFYLSESISFLYRMSFPEWFICYHLSKYHRYQWNYFYGRLDDQYVHVIDMKREDTLYPPSPL